MRGIGHSRMLQTRENFVFEIGFPRFVKDKYSALFSLGYGARGLRWVNGSHVVFPCEVGGWMRACVVDTRIGSPPEFAAPLRSFNGSMYQLMCSEAVRKTESPRITVYFPFLDHKGY